MNESQLLTTAQAAAQLGISARQVINLIQTGHLKAIRPAWAFFVTEAALADFERRKAAGEVPSVGRPRKP